MCNLKRITVCSITNRISILIWPLTGALHTHLLRWCSRCSRTGWHIHFMRVSNKGSSRMPANTFSKSFLYKLFVSTTDTANWESATTKTLFKVCAWAGNLIRDSSCWICLVVSVSVCESMFMHFMCRSYASLGTDTSRKLNLFCHFHVALKHSSLWLCVARCLWVLLQRPS